MSRWWRAYDEAIDDPKLQRLPAPLFKAWFNLCCLCSQNGGMLPPVDDIAFKLRVTPAKADEIFLELLDLKLIDVAEDGTATMHNWSARQFQSDVSTDRVKRFRERRGNVSATPTETPPDTETEAETEAETESEKKVCRAVAVATRPAVDQKFDEFKRVYPKRKGGNPWKPAKTAFDALLKRGEDADRIIALCRAGVGYDREKIGTEFIPQAVVWLRQERFNDASVPPTGPPQPPPGLPSDEELRQQARKRMTDEQRNRTPATPNGTDHEGQFLASGDAVRGGQPRRPADDRAGQRGMVRVGAVLPKALTLGTVGAGRCEDRENPGDDGPDAMASVVR